MVVVILSALVSEVTFFVGQKDPADSFFWYLGLFVLAVMAGRLNPVRPWRWGVAVILPQSLLSFFPEPSNLWPLGLLFLCILALPLILAAKLGALLWRERFGVQPATQPDPK